MPEAPILCAAITGAVDIVRFPKRPQIRVRFFEPDPDRAREGESAIGLTRRVMGEVRQAAPFAVPGRRRKAAEFQRIADEGADRAKRA